MNRPTFASTRRALASLLVAAVVAAGCGSSESDDAASATDTAETEATPSSSTEDGAADGADSGASEDPSEDGPVEATEVDDSESDDDGTDESEDETDGSCLIGNWVLTEEVMNSYYDGLESSMDGAPVDFQIDGSTTLDFNADGTFEYLPAFTLTLDTGGIGGEGVTSGSVRGTYTIDAEAGTVLADITEDDLDIVVTVSGVTISAADLGTDLAVAPINEAPFDCSGPNPVLMFEVADGARVPVALTPA